MMIPRNPINDTGLLTSCRKVLDEHNDFVVIHGASFSVSRRTSGLSNGEKDSLVAQLRDADIARVCVGRGAPLPPFFALSEIDEGIFRLICYVSRGPSSGSPFDQQAAHSDLEILKVIGYTEETVSCIEIPTPLATFARLPTGNADFVRLSLV